MAFSEILVAAQQMNCRLSGNCPIEKFCRKIICQLTRVVKHLRVSIETENKITALHSKSSMNFNCELVESKTNCSDCSIEGLEVPNKDTMLVVHSEDNLRIGVADLDKKLQLNSEVTNNECGVPFTNATEDSAIKFDSYLKRLKDDNIEVSMTHDNSRSLPVLSMSGDFETETSTAHPKQAIKKMLSENDEEMCVDVLGGAIGSRHSSPLSVGCTQYHEEKERKPKRKQRNKRKRSSGLVQKGLKREYVFHTV